MLGSARVIFYLFQREKITVNTPNNRKLPTLLCLLVSATLFICAAPLQADESGWDYTGSIYIWGTSITITTTAGQEGELPFYQILDDLKMVMMGDFTARKDKWSVSSDLIYMDIKQGRERDFTTPRRGNGTLKGSIQMKSWIVTSTVGYAFYDNEKARVEVIGGVRYLWLKAGLKINEDGTPVFDEAAANSFWDGVIGMRAEVNLNENWYVPAYFDIGAGNSDGTWQALGGIGYRWKRYQTSLVYRYLDYDFDDIPTQSGLQVKGPLLSFSFNF
jgi:hypothetical protein